MLKALNRFTVCVLVCYAFGWALHAPAVAGINSDQFAVESTTREGKFFFERDRVRAQLESQGVDADIAKARLDALTDEEVKMLSAHIIQLPEESSEILGLLLALFLILYITDILGLTKILPFTRSIR